VAPLRGEPPKAANNPTRGCLTRVALRAE
jgi:hypothetical protein